MIHSNKAFFGLAAGTFAVSLVIGSFAHSALDARSVEPAHGGAHASWVSNAETVAEQVLEADLVVRVQAVDRAEARHLWHPLPAGVERVDDKGTFAFTDTEVEVLEVYRGGATVGERLWVMQTGADLTTTNGKLARLELAEDPLYGVGDEMVLFLVDISDDSVHAADRELYRTVNPAGRYQVEGSLATRVGPRAAEKAVRGLGELESEIAAAVEMRAQLER